MTPNVTLNMITPNVVDAVIQFTEDIHAHTAAQLIAANSPIRHVEQMPMADLACSVMNIDSPNYLTIL
jgi:hypothetical protein